MCGHLITIKPPHPFFFDLEKKMAKKYLTAGALKKVLERVPDSARIRFTTDDLAQWTTRATDAHPADSSDCIAPFQDTTSPTRVIIFGKGE
jgi:hypothetical protein